MSEEKKSIFDTIAANKISVAAGGPDESEFRNFKLKPDELEKKINDYFEFGANQREIVMQTGKNKYTKTVFIYTLTGLCLYCGFNDKTHFFQLERNNAYKDIIKKARTKIEQIYEENLQVSGNSANIFALKNFGWVDKQEVIHEERTLKLDI